MLDEKGFDLWADGYDQTVQVSDEENSYPFAGYKRVLAAVYEAVRTGGAKSVLDVGFGTGVLSKKLYDDGLAVTGIDFSQRMIELARAKMPGARLIQHDFAEGLPVEVTTSRYDAIISTYALHHLADAEKAEMLRQLFGLLSPGGVLVYGDVAFETAADGEALHSDAFDEDEFYFDYESFKRRLGVPSTYRQFSICAGILTLKKPRMVFFDFGETLAMPLSMDFKEGARALLDRATDNQSGLSLEEVHAFSDKMFWDMDVARNMNIEVHEHNLLRFVYEYLGISLDMTLEEQEMLYWNASVQSAPMEGVETLLACLRAQGIRTGVISNITYSGKALAQKLSDLLPGHTFEMVIASSDYVLRKPNPLLFGLALRKAGVDASDAWHCGDLFDKDVEGAVAAGIMPIWYGEETDDARMPAGKAVRDWRELTAWMGCTTMND